MYTDGPHSVSASFTNAPPPPLPKFDLKVAKAGSGSGYVGGGGGIDCDPTCAATEVAGSNVQLTALADPGSRFSGWTGACSGVATCDLTMNTAATVTATFERLPPELRALPSAGTDGQFAKLRYTLKNSNPGHREGMIVSKGRRVLAQVAKAHTSLAGGVYFIRWRVPLTVSPGLPSFCIVAADPSTSKNTKSCAPLRIGRG